MKRSVAYAVAALVVLSAAGVALLWRATRGTSAPPSVAAVTADAAQPALTIDAGSNRTNISPQESAPNSTDRAADLPGGEARAATATPADAGPLDPSARIGLMHHLQTSRDAYVAGDYPRALAAAETVLAASPDRLSAHRIAALSACQLGRGEVAQRHAEIMDRRRFEDIQAYCKAVDIHLRHPYESPQPPRDAGPAGPGETSSDPQLPAHDAATHGSRPPSEPD